jgi:hypothetical protein
MGQADSRQGIGGVGGDAKHEVAPEACRRGYDFITNDKNS